MWSDCMFQHCWSLTSYTQLQGQQTLPRPVLLKMKLTTAVSAPIANCLPNWVYRYYIIQGGAEAEDAGISSLPSCSSTANPGMFCTNWWPTIRKSDQDVMKLCSFFKKCYYYVHFRSCSQWRRVRFHHTCNWKLTRFDTTLDSYSYEQLS